MAEGSRRLDTRLRVPLALFTLTLGLFALQRVIVWALLSERFVGTSSGEYLHALVVGLRYDLNIACTAALPVVALIAFVPVRTFGSAVFRGVLTSLMALVIAFFVALAIIDVFFFEEYGERLNNKAVDYLADASTWKMLWHDYPMAIAAVAVVVGFLGLRRLLRRACFAGGHHASPVWRAVLRLVVLLPLVALGVRGTFDQKGLNTSLAYSSDSVLLAQWSLNGAFTLRETLGSRLGRAISVSDVFEPLPDDEALALTTDWLIQPGDTPTGHADNPLMRITDTGRPRTDQNVVLVVMESLSWHYIEAMGGETGLTPHLDAMIADGVLMERCFAVGTRTSRGLSGILSGFPDLPGVSVTKRIEGEGALLTLAEMLRRRDYQTLFVHAGEASFDHMQSFTRTNGYDHAVFMDAFDAPSFGNSYGWCDDDLYAQSLLEIDALQDGDDAAPFFATLLTLSFHRPYEVPEGRVEQASPEHEHSDQLTSARYADQALGDFMAQARTRPWFDDTLFVFVADHPGGFRDKPMTQATYRVPFLLYGPEVPGLRDQAGQRVDAVCSQTDVPPTILSMLGGSYEHCFFGADVLTRLPEDGLALLQRNELISMVSAGGEVIELRPGTPSRLYQYQAPDDVRDVPEESPGAADRAAALDRRVRALLQTAEQVFTSGGYQLDDAR